MLIGADVSQWQNNLSPNNLDFLIVKASQGAGFRDPHFAMHVETALSRGQLVFAYHFSENGEGAAGAENLLAAIAPYAGQLAGVCQDVEYQNDGVPNVVHFGPTYADVLAWHSTVAAARPGIRRYLYTAGYYWTSVLGNPTPPAGAALWWAHVVSDYNNPNPAALAAQVTKPPFPDLPWPDYAFRQVGIAGAVGGIAPVDIDITFLTRDQLTQTPEDDLTNDQATMLNTIGRAVFEIGGVVTQLQAGAKASAAAIAALSAKIDTFYAAAMNGDTNGDGKADHYGLAQVHADLQALANKPAAAVTADLTPILTELDNRLNALTLKAVTA